MKLFLKRSLIPALLLLAVPSFSQEKPALATMPEGCGNPFAEAEMFVSFYESTLKEIAALQGAKSRGVVELYSVLLIRGRLREMMTNPSEQNPVDALLLTQICQFHKIKFGGEEARVGQKRVIVSSDTELHKHLQLVAPRMYGDSLDLLRRYQLRKGTRLKYRKFIQSRASEIERAKKLARSRVKDLF